MVSNRHTLLKRRRRPVLQSGLLLGLVVCVYASSQIWDRLHGKDGSQVGTAGNRMLLQTSLVEDKLTMEEKRSGGVILYLLCMVYMFIGLAVVCDEYFVSALEYICEHLQISDDVAGATFMAAGGSAPELFTNLVGTFFVRSDVGFATIVGSAVFNVLFVIGLCAYFAGQVLELTWYPLFRDASFYSITLAVLVAFVYDRVVTWWESLVLVLLYVLYVIIMRYNEQLKAFCMGAAGSQVAPNQDTALQVPNGVEMGPRGSQLNPLKRQHDEEDGTRVHSILPQSLNWRSNTVNQLRNTETEVENGKESQGAAWPKGMENGNNTNGAAPEPKAEEEEEAPGGMPSWPSDASPTGKLYFVMTAPIVYSLFFTIPDCRRPGHEKFYMLTFTMSILWIAIFSYFMVWCAEIIGHTLYIPISVMGITILAAGTSIPDALSSVIVAREGHGDMALSSSIGSNVFDVTFGLPVPWLIYTGIVYPGKTIGIDSTHIWISVSTLLGMVIATITTVHCMGWKISKPLGIVMFVLYVIFLAESVWLAYG